MNLRECFHRATVCRPHEIPYRTARFFWRKLKRVKRYQADKRFSSYAAVQNVPKGELITYFEAIPTELLKPSSATIAGIAKHYIAHRFDLLGSGWVQVRYGMRCRGLEGNLYVRDSPKNIDSKDDWMRGWINETNFREALRIWALVDSSYSPIDWHLDIKSGHRWNQTVWYRKIPYSPQGSDIKVPWELARMQHLPQLAWAYALAAEGQEGFEKPEVYAKEFRNQVLDFISNNPPRFGVNWECTMEVGIRVSNWLVAYDLFRLYGAKFDREFMEVFIRSIYEHGFHIINNLEWFAELRANHYLSDIVGLLFAAAYLPGTEETDAWLAFAVQELVKEVKAQFNPDGSNFEGSTSYHRLSGELVVYATALVLGVMRKKSKALRSYNYRLIKVQPGLKPSPLPVYESFSGEKLPFPAWYINRLEMIAEFTWHITKPSGLIPQIGDNDSGRFLKLHPLYRQMTVAEAKARYANLRDYTDLPDDEIYWDEIGLDHRHLVAAVNALFLRNDFRDFTKEFFVDSYVIRALSSSSFPSYLLAGELPVSMRPAKLNSESWRGVNNVLTKIPETLKSTLELPFVGESLLEGLKFYQFPDFGLYIFRSNRLYLAVRCGPTGQNGNGGHAHNDQLSVELTVDNIDVISDPGTYIYTALPQKRNEYRSVLSHFAPQFKGMEPGNLKLGLFQLGNEARAKCLFFGAEGFVGRHSAFGWEVYRVVVIEEKKIIITDYIDGGDIALSFNERFLEGRDSLDVPSVSPGYGVIL